jgi:hypothetical protein
MVASTNSRVSRVRPIFAWLRDHGGPSWPTQLLRMAEGMPSLLQCGPVTQMHLDCEEKVGPTPERLAWMLSHSAELTPRDGRRWDELRQRVADPAGVKKALDRLATGTTKGLPKRLVLEGATHADCLIECADALIWIEGKRFDWLDPSTKWDVTRDQIARNIDALASRAGAAGKDYRLLICHEQPLKHHETLLLMGYRSGTWLGGLPHVSMGRRQDFAARIGTLTWAAIVGHWPGLATLPELHDLPA